MDIKDSWLLNQFVAHRGFHNKENPENTLGAAKRAIENNYAIECDVRMLADGTLVLFHDDTLSRVTHKDGYVSALLKDDLKKMKILDSEQTIPTVEELLKLVNGQVPILFDIKDSDVKSDRKLEKTLSELLDSYDGEFAVASSNPYVVWWFKENRPAFLRGYVSSFYRNEEEGKQFVKSWIVRKLLKHLALRKKIKPNFVMYCKDNLPNRFVKKAKLPVLGWTVRSKTELEKTFKYADNIIFENFEPKI